MIKIKDEGVVLRGRNTDFERGGVLNPTCVTKDGITHIFYRAVDKDNLSTVGYCQLNGKMIVKRSDRPILFPEYDYEKMGTEDPRVTFFEDTYFLFYTAFDGQNARIAYATSKNLEKFEKRGLISPSMSYDLAEDIFRNANLDKRYTFFEKVFRELRGDNVLLWEKDASLFPKRFGGKYALIHRVLPGIQVCYFDNFEELKNLNYWSEYLSDLKKYIIIDPENKYENGYIGGGCAPLEVEEGWLLIYHAVEIMEGRKIYRASVVLLDKNDPQKIISRLKEPLFEPKEDWELYGVTNNVVFPTGCVIEKDDLTIYYGAADRVIGAKSLKLESLLKELRKT